MSHKFSLALVGSLIVVFGFIGAGKANAAWVIDRSGTLLEVDSMALGFTTPTVAEVDVEGNLESPGWAIDPDSVIGKDGEVPTSERVRKGGQVDLVELEARREKAMQQFQLDTEKRQQQHLQLKQTVRSQIQSVGGELTVRQDTYDEKGKVVKTTDTPLPKKEKLRIEQEDAPSLQVHSNDEDGDDESLVIDSEKVRTRTNFPLLIGEDNSLSIVHRDGTPKPVTILPDAAMKRLELKGFTPTPVAELTVSGNEPVYDVDVKEVKRFLGVFKQIAFDKHARIQAKTGEISDQPSPQMSAWQRFLDRFSF